MCVCVCERACGWVGVGVVCALYTVHRNELSSFCAFFRMILQMKDSHKVNVALDQHQLQLLKGHNQ